MVLRMMRLSFALLLISMYICGGYGYLKPFTRMIRQIHPLFVLGNYAENSVSPEEKMELSAFLGPCQDNFMKTIIEYGMIMITNT